MSSIDATAIHDSLNPDVAARMDRLEVFAEIDSTNSYLLQQRAPAPGVHRVAIADHQTAGRGRHGREWISAPGSSLCLSLAYTFSDNLANLPNLTLAMGVAAHNALRLVGVDDIMLKWPNDIVARDCKLGGMLTESHCRDNSNLTVVAGIGINVDLPARFYEDSASRWTQRATDLRHLVSGPVSHESLSGALINELVESLLLFESCGFVAFADAWRRRDWLCGREITVEHASGRVSGTASGIDDDGALLLRSGRATTRIVSGSIIIGDAQGTHS